MTEDLKVHVKMQECHNSVREIGDKTLFRDLLTKTRRLPAPASELSSTPLLDSQPISMPPVPALPPSNFKPPASFLRQRLNLEYSTIIHHPPESIYLSPSLHTSQPSHLPTWTGVFLPREGPYSPSALRFSIIFTPHYPLWPPRVLFTTEVFHPLVVPLSTYRYSYTAPTGVNPGSTEQGAEKDADGSEDQVGEQQQELEPGEFNLRCGLKMWFDEARKSRSKSRDGSRQVSGESYKSSVTTDTNVSGSTRDDGYGYKYNYGVRDVLKYVTDAFTELNGTLATVPLEGAANPSAWLAWRSWRAQELGIEDAPQSEEDPANTESAASHPTAEDGRPSSGQRGNTDKRSSSAKRPEQWDWTNVFLERVRRNCEASLGDGALYGGASGGGGEDLIRFLDMAPEDLEKIKEVAQKKGEVVQGRVN